MNAEQARIWGTALLVANYVKSDREFTLPLILEALSSDENFDRAIESREETLERQLQKERADLRALEHTNPVEGPE